MPGLLWERDFKMIKAASPVSNEHTHAHTQTHKLPSPSLIIPLFFSSLFLLKANVTFIWVECLYSTFTKKRGKKKTWRRLRRKHTDARGRRRKTSTKVKTEQRVEKKNTAASFLPPLKPSSANSTTSRVNERGKWRKERRRNGGGACKMSEKSKEIRKWTWGREGKPCRREESSSCQSRTWKLQAFSGTPGKKLFWSKTKRKRTEM